MTEPSYPFDPTPYLRPPVLDVPTAIALGISLLAATNRELPVAVRKSARALRKSVLSLQTNWGEQRASALAAKVDPRPADQRLDRAWGAIARSLEAFAALGEHIPESVAAAALHVRLFNGGLGFLALPYAKQWAESEQRLQVIERAELASEIDRLLGAFVLKELREAHAAYGEVLNITNARQPTKTPASVLESLRQVQQSITAYCLQLTAAAFADPELVPLVRRALRPLDELRETQSRRTANRTAALEPLPEVTPETPLPTVDDLEPA